MFTGIVQEVGTIYETCDLPNARSYKVKLPVEYCRNLMLGASIANNGVCLTTRQVNFYIQGEVYFPEQFEQAYLSDKFEGLELRKVTPENYCVVHFDLISTTLKLTNLAELKTGDKLNIERSFVFGSEVGGHILSGHICGTIPVVEIINQDNIYQIEFELPEEFKRYILDKGFVAVDGMSLTVSSITKRGFTVNIIPETLARTIVGNYKVGTRVNLEIDNQTRLIIDTVESYLKTKDIRDQLENLKLA